MNCLVYGPIAFNENAERQELWKCFTTQSILQWVRIIYQQTIRYILKLSWRKSNNTFRIHQLLLLLLLVPPQLFHGHTTTQPNFIDDEIHRNWSSKNVLESPPPPPSTLTEEMLMQLRPINLLSRFEFFFSIPMFHRIEAGLFTTVTFPATSSSMTLCRSHALLVRWRIRGWSVL